MIPRRSLATSAGDYGADESKVLLVGEVNPLGSGPRYALYHLPRTSSGNRLRCILGLTDLEYHRLLDKVNLCDGEWSTKRAAFQLADLMGTRSGTIVLLGARIRTVARKLLRAVAPQVPWGTDPEATT